MTDVMKYPVETRKYGFKFEDYHWKKRKAGEKIVPRDTREDIPRQIKIMPSNIWSSFYRLAQKTGVITNDELEKEEIQRQIIVWFNKHGVPPNNLITYKGIKQLMILLEDLYLARLDGDSEEFKQLIEQEEDLILGLMLDVDVDVNGKVEPSFVPNGFNEAIIMDFLFSTGGLERWFVCDHCGNQFQNKRKKLYCTPSCKRSAAHYRQKARRTK